jgi:hypothetical protein
MAGAYCWFPDDVFNILAAIVAARKPLTAIVAARKPLTDDEKQIIISVATGFGLQVYFKDDNLTPR